MADLLWEVVGAGDFNGDGVDDILWRHYDGTISNWLGSTNGTFTVNDTNALAAVSNDWHIAGTGDFNGDGRDDIVWQRDDGGMTSNWLGTADGGFFINDENALTKWGSPIIAIGDFNGDGLDDVIMRNSIGELYYAPTGAGGYFDFHMAYGFLIRQPTNWDIVGTGDYNGDGIDDLLWRNNVDGRLSNWLGGSTGFDFTINDANALVHVPLAWQVAEDPLI